MGGGSVPYTELFAEDEEPETVHTVAHYLVTAAQSEGEAVALPALVRLQPDVDGGVVRRGVTGIGAVLVERRREANVAHLQPHDLGLGGATIHT